MMDGDRALAFKLDEVEVISALATYGVAGACCFVWLLCHFFFCLVG